MHGVTTSYRSKRALQGVAVSIDTKVTEYKNGNDTMSGLHYN